MGYAEVCVNSPLAQRHTFSYSIPPGLNITAGQAVLVPFGNKLLQGIVLDLKDYPSVEETKEIAGLLEPRPVLSPIQIQLSYWLSEYYLSPLFDAVALMLAPGFERKALTFLSAAKIPDDLSTLTADKKNILKIVQEQGRVNLNKLQKVFGKKKTRTIVSQMVKSGLVERRYELEQIKIKPKFESYISLTMNPDEAEQQVATLRSKRALIQADLLDFIIKQAGLVSIREVRGKVGASRASINALISKGLVAIQQVQIRRNPFLPEATPSSPLVFTAAQESAFKEIKDSLQSRKKSNVFLLHGVTGSGKTEVYLQALAEAVKLGKRGIVLVPEISLTPQTIERFASRFPERVAVLHSQLSPGEQFDEWQRIRNGEFDVVIGPRSALFAPQPDLGFIVIDEEHEWTYKQQDKSPRYHTRNVAIKLAELTGATVVLGSATPDVETFYHAEKDDYRLLRLPERVTPREGSPLPEVEVVDLREELRAGNLSLFSRSLSRAIAQAVSNGEQVILFLNRRGSSTLIQCRNCGFVLRCRRCEVSLTYHSAEDTMVCHQCNYRTPVPQICPRCRSRRISFLGSGTQKLEEEARRAFPSARLLRWDSDVTTREKQANLNILNMFRTHQADILIGTQIIAKGLDLPGVTLVGVINADTGLNLPDFRAGERVFQILSQVAGRAGRGALGGRVIIQTYSPEHYAIEAAARHDYALFYEQEIAYRRQLHNPPFNKLASLIYSHTNNALSQREAERMRQVIIEETDSRGISDLTVIGPAPAFIHRLRGRFRWQLVLRGSNLADFLSALSIPKGWTVDIDPVGLS